MIKLMKISNRKILLFIYGFCCYLWIIIFFLSDQESQKIYKYPTDYLLMDIDILNPLKKLFSLTFFVWWLQS